MENVNVARWDIGTTIKAGKETLKLVQQFQDDFLLRLAEGEIEMFDSSVKSLERQSSGQGEKLTKQKISTLSHNECKIELHEQISSLREVVKSSNATPAVSKAFLVGEKISDTPKSLIAASNVMIESYEKNKEWCNKSAAIIDADIQEICDLLEHLSELESKKTDAKHQRKMGTLDKKSIHCSVEASIIHYSALGAHIFRKKDPSVAALFDNLVPTTPKNKQNGETNTDTPAADKK